MDGGFVVNGCNKGSGVPFDQALEQSYNRPAKVSGGIIGVTRKKDAVALWDIIKHKKDEYVHLLKKRDDVDGKLWLHHEFNLSTTDKHTKMGQEVKAYIVKLCCSFLQHEHLKNMVTGQVVTAVNVKMLLSCMKEGSNAHGKYVEDRIRNKTASIHATISRTKFNVPKETSRRTSKVDVKDETIKALLYMEYARHRGFTIEEILQYEITSSAFFLVDNEGYLRKPNKSQLGIELLKLCPEIDSKGPETLPHTNVCIIDFMALVRTVSLKKRQPPVKTFGDFATCLTAMIMSASCDSDEVHIVFDTYKDDSIKNMERLRRGKCKDMLVFDVVSPNQNVPVHLDKFWASSVSKTAFQAFYVEWLTSNYHGNKPLHLGIQPKSWRVSAGHVHHCPLLDCTHEEADDRIMFHIQVILSDRTSSTSVTVFSADTDVFICLLYHLSTNWRYHDLTELWVVRNSGVKRSVLPVHDICTSLDDKLVQCLPALHALTGCDSTSKISTKLSALNTIRIPENTALILNFGCPQLTELATQMAELFLVKCLKSSADLETFNALRVGSFDKNSLKFDSEKTACTSSNARKHIRRSYYQVQLWIQAPHRDASQFLNAELYGWETVDGILVPEVISAKPHGLPDPCKCGKCARKNVCPCRIAEVKCCRYCKCKAGDDCKNPIKSDIARSGDPSSLN